MSDSNIYVTRPYLPPLAELIPYLEKIWDNQILTNAGPFHQEFEQALGKFLGVDYLSLFTNGTLGLVTALQCLRISGEVITTPYSFVATAHALLWNGIKPVFVDIDPVTMNLDPAKIEAAITPQTTAILPVHCYGRACDVTAIGKIADNYNLRIIYDAAHAFDVREGNGSILRHGDLSVLSFHATKAFNTFEGGAIICQDAKTKQRIDHLRNCGFVDEVTVVAPGINGKMSEFNAALGLLQLRHYHETCHRRRQLAQTYLGRLTEVQGIVCPDSMMVAEGNCGYFPILVGDEFHLARDALYEKLRQQGVFARRYFYPLISEFPMYRGLPSATPGNLPVATDISRRVLCLPIYPSLTDEDQMRVIDLIVH